MMEDAVATARTSLRPLTPSLMARSQLHLHPHRHPTGKYTRAYLHHVVKADEIIGSMLLTWHNLHYYQVLMQGLRDAIAAGGLAGFVAGFHARRAEGDVEPV